MHDPTFLVGRCQLHLGLGPLRDEVDEDLWFDHCSRGVGDNVPINSGAHLAILLEMSGLRVTSPKGNNVTRVTECNSK
jgi:hypothetical protein